MLDSRILRLCVTVVAVCAVLGLSVLPAVHVHKSVSGKVVAHNHVIADPVEHAGALDHGDHRGVQTFAPAFTIERTLPIAVPVLISGPVVRPPEPRPLGHVDALDAPLIHGPPLRVLSLRAPPA